MIGTDPHDPDSSPAGGFRETAFTVRENARKLAGNQISLAYAPHKRGVLAELSAVKLMWIEDADGKFELLRYDSDRFRQIRIIRNEDRDFKAFQIGISQQVRCEIHVGAFFLSLVDPHLLRRRHTG